MIWFNHFETDSLKLPLEKEYNLNVVKEVKVTEAFLGLGKEVIKCQNDETYDDCRTRRYFDAIKNVCQCLPFSVRRSNEVWRIDKVNNILLYEISVSPWDLIPFSLWDQGPKFDNFDPLH